MKFHTLVLLCCLARFAPAQQSACRPVEGDRILGKDLEAALPAFHLVPAEAVIGASPSPGSTRTFHAAELVSIARQYSIQFTGPVEISFCWDMQPLKSEVVLQAMRNSLGLPDADVEIAEMTISKAPPGRIEFPRERLVAPGTADLRAPVLWRGDVIYANGRRFPIWARVRITAPCRRVTAVETLKPGHPIDASQLRQESGQCFPGAKSGELTIDRAAGQVPLRFISSGAEVRSDLLTAPNEVDRGDLIQVEVRSGSARLIFVGKAEAGGRTGDLIAVRNPDSNKIFQARVNGKDKALVQAGLKGN